MSDKKRYIAGYEVINSIHIGDKEIVLGMNLNDRDGHYYMLTDCERNELFERYTNSVVSNSFIELAESFLCRLNEQIEKVKIAENKLLDEKIKQRYEELKRNNYKDNKFCIRPAKTLNDMSSQCAKALKQIQDKMYAKVANS